MNKKAIIGILITTNIICAGGWISTLQKTTPAESVKKVEAKKSTNENKKIIAQSRIGIIGAMDEEIALLKKEMKIEEKVNKAGMEFCIGKLEGQDVVVVRSGIGKVNAADCAQILISEFETTAVINTGCAGAINENLNVGDTVISTNLMEHDFDTTIFGNKPGEIPRMESSVFEADKNLIEVAFKASKEINDKHNTIKGKIVSGDQFISSKNQKERLDKIFQADSAEMEGASIAHTCVNNNVPFVIIRSMSDKADGTADITYEEFEKEASVTSSKIVKAMLQKLSNK